MKGVSVWFLIAICSSWASAQFLNNKPHPTYSLENMPQTEFTCRDKILGGYYADAQTQCQMFHICVKVAGVGVQDFRFLCPNGTAFDQDHQICADWEDVDCDSTTLYYSSDNFDLYRIGSGLESKAVKYGEDEETFALQRAETGDTRLNREHQSGSVNQQRELTHRRTNQQKQPVIYNNNNNNNNNNNGDREIFKGSSSSNFFNNRNNGKERDEDYDENVNVNQNRDVEQRRKAARVNGQRRPQARGQTTSVPTTVAEVQTRRPAARPSTFVNNFAGSYTPTTARSTSPAAASEQYGTTRGRGGQRRPQYDDAAPRQTETSAPGTTSSSASTQAPFRQTQQYITPPNRQPTQTADNGKYYTTTTVVTPRRDTEIYTQKQKQTTPYDSQYDTPKVKPTKADSYPSTATYETKKTTPFAKTENYPSNNPLYFDKKSTTPVKQAENYPTTFSPKPKPFSASSQSDSGLPSTFAPRTNDGFTQIVQQTEQFKPSTAQHYDVPKSTTKDEYYGSSTKSSTPKSTQYSTQYTPTVPKISTTTPGTGFQFKYAQPSKKILAVKRLRSSRFDETEYDHDHEDDHHDHDDDHDDEEEDHDHDHDHDSFFNDRKEDEFLRTAHSQNIAASRNELAKTTTKQPSTSLPQSESPRPFSVSPSTPKSTGVPGDSSTIRITGAPRETESSRSPPRPEQPKKSDGAGAEKKTKDASYDYAYYDSNPSSEPEYDIETELKKSHVRD